MIRTIPFLALSLIAFFFSACQSGPDDGSSASGQTVGLSANGETFTLNVGEQIHVALPQNASTGYTWELDESYQPVLKTTSGPKSEQFQTGPTSATPVNLPAAVGTPSVKTWTFVAKKVGETTIKLSYLRPWEKDKEPIKVFEITVKVEE